MTPARRRKASAKETLEAVLEVLEHHGVSHDKALPELPLRSCNWATWDDVANTIEKFGPSPSAIDSYIHDQLDHEEIDLRRTGAGLLFWTSRWFDGPAPRDWIEPIIHLRIPNQREDDIERAYLVRFAGITGLSPDRFISQIILQLQDSSAAVRLAAIDALTDYGTVAKDTWVEIVERMRTERSSEVWEAFNRFVEEISFQSANSHIELEQQFTEKLMSLLTQTTRRSKSEIKCVAISILMTLGDRAYSATEALRDAVLDNNMSVACSAANALGAIGPKARAAIPALVKARQCQFVRWHADEALARIDPQTHATLQLQEILTREAGNPSSSSPEVIFIPPKKIQIGSEPAIVLTDAEGEVVQALIELGAADGRELTNRFGGNQPGRVLKRIITKYPSLAAYFSLPGGKGHGGYRTCIKHEP